MVQYKLNFSNYYHHIWQQYFLDRLFYFLKNLALEFKHLLFHHRCPATGCIQPCDRPYNETVFICALLSLFFFSFYSFILLKHFIWISRSLWPSRWLRLRPKASRWIRQWARSVRTARTSAKRKFFSSWIVNLHSVVDKCFWAW